MFSMEYIFNRYLLSIYNQYFESGCIYIVGNFKVENQLGVYIDIRDSEGDKMDFFLNLVQIQ